MSSRRFLPLFMVQAMRNNTVAGAHGQAMRSLMPWCDEASVVHGEQDGVDAPTWEEACDRMIQTGRSSKVKHPSELHLKFEIARPTSRRLTRPIDNFDSERCMSYRNGLCALSALRALCASCLLCGMLAACGPDAAVTAATAAKVQAAQVEQARAQQEQLKKNLEEAMRATEAAASAAGNQ